MLARLPTFTRTIERWLKAGSVDMGAWHASETGAPQGGILSPVLANVALDGMERLFGGEDRDGNPVKAATKKGMDKSVVLIRYADDVLDGRARGPRLPLHFHLHVRRLLRFVKHRPRLRF